MTATAAALDLDLAAAGYLVSPDSRHLRWIAGLDRIGQDAHELGASILWRRLPGSHAACCDCECARIYLAPWVFYAWPWFVRSAICEELMHCRYGPGEERARAAARRLYGDLLEPIGYHDGTLWRVA